MTSTDKSAAEREAFEACLKAMPEWAPEFKEHKPWVEALAWIVWREARASLTIPSKEPATPQPACAPAAVGEIVTFGTMKEVSWTKGKMPAVGTKLYAAPGAAIDAREQEAKSVPMERIERLARGIQTAKKAEDSMALVAELLRECALASRPEAPPASAPAAEVAQRMTLSEFCAEADRIGLTVQTLAKQLVARPEFADCLPSDEQIRRAICTASLEWASAHTTSSEDSFIGDALRELFASSPSSAPAESGWQPIETAPKDGTQIVLLWDGKVVVGHWFRGESVWSGPAQNWIKDQWGLNSVAYRSAPTHWQPLPAAPQAVQAGGEGGNG